MKKLFVKGGIALLGAMLVLAFAACPTDSGSGSNKSGMAVLEGFQAVTDVLVVDGVLGEAITDWEVYTDYTGFTEEQKGTLDFEGAAASAAVTFYETASAKAAVTYAVMRSAALPTAGDFRAITDETPDLATNDVIYFKVVSENGKVTNYYCVVVTGLGDAPSNSTGISVVTIGGGNPYSPPQSAGSPVIGSVELQDYDLPSANMAGDVALLLNRNNSGQTISWAKIAEGAAAPADSAFTVFAQPASGNTLSATISADGMADGDTVYIKVVAADKYNVLFYGFTVSVGNIAELASLSLAGTAVTNLGSPGTAWDTVASAGTFDYQDEIPAGGFALAATAVDSGAIAYAIMESAAEPNFTALTGTPSVTLGTGSILYLRVTSVSGNKTVYYKINVFTKASTTIYYGQPVITQGTDGGAPDLDALWDTQNWMFNVSRINLAEDPPLFRFLNTVSGNYDDTGFGHTEGKAKAFWDDGGMYVYAEMSFHDYYENAEALEALTATERTTVLSPPVAVVADNNAHLYDSLEIFTNERVQRYTEGGFGIQYRVAPSPEGQTVAGTNSRISGNPPGSSAGAGSSAITAFRESGKYYTWIRKDGAGKEQGYSIIAYIPWLYKADADANQVFSGGLVATTGNDAGPTVGVEFQLDAVTTGGARDAILTWNGVNGQSYNQVANYGRAMLVTGDLAARGITRGANDPVPVTVTFDTNGGTPATIAPISVTPGLPAGTLFPEDPTPPSGYRFTGWYDESVTPNVRYSSTTIINNDLNLKARYTESSGSGTLIWSMADWLVTYPPKENGEILYYSSSARPFTVTSSSTPALVVDGGIDIVGRTANYYTMTLWIDDSMPSSSYGGIRGLNLDPEGRIYEIRVTGSALETPKADVQMTLKAGGGQADLGIVSDTLAEVDGAPYTIIGEIPADFNSRTDGRGEIRILPSDSFNSTSNGFMSFRIDSVEVWDMGSRSGSSGYLFSLSDWIADNPEVTELTTSSTAHKPLRLNGTVPTSNSATIVGSDMELYINASGQGLHIMLDSENLDLKPVENIYEVRIAGYISDLGTGSTPGGTPAIRIQTYYGGTATVLEGDLSLKPSSGDAYVGFEFAKAVELPATAINPGDSVRITVSSNAATMTFIMTKIEIEDKGPREGGGGEEPEPEPPALGVIFNLDDWFTANPTVTEITSTGGIGYLGRSSSGTLITIVDVDGSKEINIRYQQGLGGTDSGTTHGLDIKIDSASLNVTTDTRLYGLRIDGYVVGTPPAGQGMRLRNSGGTVTYGSTTLEEELDAVFNITTAELPASSSSDVMRIQLNPALATGTELNVRITGIEIEDLGPRE